MTNSQSELTQMLSKSLKIKKEKQKKLEEAKQQPQNEEVKQEEEFMQQQYANKQESNVTLQQLNSNELIFIDMFVLINDARIHFLKHLTENPKEQNNMEHCRFQNFAETLMVLFTNIQVDQDHLRQRMTELVEIQAKEYILTLQKFQEQEVKSDDFRFLLERDVKLLLKARIHSNLQVSKIAKFLMNLYCIHFPLLLFNKGVTGTLLDCIQILIEEINNEYQCQVTPRCLKTIKEYVFMPCDHEILQNFLKSLVELLSKLYVFAALYSKKLADENLEAYIQKFKVETLSSRVDTPNANYHIEIIQNIQKNLNLSRLKKFCIDKNVYDLNVLLLNSPDKATEMIDQATTPELGYGAFYSQNSLMSLQQIVHGSSDTSNFKLSAFPIRVNSTESSETYHQ